MTVYVDIDGCLLDGSMDAEFQAKTLTLGVEAALDWYHVSCRDDLELNCSLLMQLLKYKATGHLLVVWTNRGHEQVDVTLRNLAKYGIVSIFDGFIFGDGNKLEADTSNAIVIDNEWRNLEGQDHPILIPTFI